MPHRYVPAALRAAALILSTLLAACSSGGGGQAAPAGTSPPPPPPPAPPAAVDFSEEIIYWALTDRFANGDPANDDGDLDRAGDAADATNPIGWHGGDFAGIAAKIREGYFQRMGFTAIWISPVVLQVPAPGTGGGVNSGRLFSAFHGYWAERFDAIEPHFGTLAELRDLVDGAHAEGLKIIIDVVVNHTGYDAALVQREPDWFRTGAECGSGEVTQCLAGLPDFRQEVPEVTAFLLDAVDWLRTETGLDGIRMDTMKHVGDAFWAEFFAAGGPGDPAALWTVGEVFSADVNRIAHYLDDVGSPSVFDFPLRGAIVDAIARGGPVSRVAAVFAEDSVYSDPLRLTTFIDNHDVPRFMSEAGAVYPEAAARERLDMALSLIYLARGIPSVYYGTEIAMRGLGDPYDQPLGESNREDMDFGALAASTIDERLAALAAARRTYPSLVRGAQTTLYEPAAASGCAAPDRGLDPSADFGDVLYVRGSFDGWANPPPAGQVFRNQGAQVYLARLEIASGDHEYKVAAADWGPEFANTTEPTRLGVPITLSPASGVGSNGRISLPQRACYEFSLSAGSTTNPVLTVDAVAVADRAGDVLAFRRAAAGETPVVVVVNNDDQPVELADLGGGIEVSGSLTDGAPLIEITGRAHALTIAGGRLVGAVPGRTVLALAQ